LSSPVLKGELSESPACYAPETETSENQSAKQAPKGLDLNGNGRGRFAQLARIARRDPHECHAAMRSEDSIGQDNVIECRASPSYPA
jgi:hypothetical protein